MNIMALAIILLILRTISVGFMLRVLTISYPLLKAHNDPQIKPLRYVLFIFAVIITIGNVIPILIDLYGLSGEDIRNDDLDTVLTVYFINNAFISAISAFCFWLVYKVSGLNTDEASKRNGDS